jgi:hypothetical protein
VVSHSSCSMVSTHRCPMEHAGKTSAITASQSQWYCVHNKSIAAFRGIAFIRLMGSTHKMFRWNMRVKPQSQRHRNHPWYCVHNKALLHSVVSHSSGSMVSTHRCSDGTCGPNHNICLIAHLFNAAKNNAAQLFQRNNLWVAKIISIVSFRRNDLCSRQMHYGDIRLSGKGSNHNIFFHNTFFNAAKKTRFNCSSGTICG